jgi:hypothetical protein
MPGSHKPWTVLGRPSSDAYQSINHPSHPVLMSSPNFQPILDAALDSYAKQTGIDLAKHPSASNLQNCRSPDDVLQILSERESAFKDYRDQYRNLIDRVRPVVKAVHALSVVLGEIAGFVSSGVAFISSSHIFTPPDRCHFIQQKRYLSASTFFSPCVSPRLFREVHISYRFTTGRDWRQRKLRCASRPFRMRLEFPKTLSNLC